MRETPGAGPRGMGNRGDPKVRDPGPRLVSRWATRGGLSLMRTGTHGPWDTQLRHRDSPRSARAGKMLTLLSQDSWIPAGLHPARSGSSLRTAVTGRDQNRSHQVTLSGILQAHLNQFIMRNITADRDGRASAHPLRGGGSRILAADPGSRGGWMDQVLGIRMILVKVLPSPAKPPELTPLPGMSPWVLAV